VIVIHQRGARSAIRRALAGAATAGLVAVFTVASSGAVTSAAAQGSSGTSPHPFATAWPKFTQKVTLTGWGWGANPQLPIANFNKMYPNITINWHNVGAGATEYTKLLAAEEAGSGAPDVTGLEYLEMPVFTSKHYLVDLAPILGSKLVDQIKDSVAKTVWDDVYQKGALYGIPGDIGPVALAYRPSIFKQYGLVVPTTWAQYASDAVKLHKANPKMYMGWVETNGTNDLTGLVQQAGGNFFKEVSPTDWKIDIDNPISEKIYNYWGNLAKNGDIAEVAEYEPAWENQLAKGVFASYLLPAWGPTFEVDEYVPKGSQSFVVTQPPQWTTSGPHFDFDSGGSANVVTAQTKDPAILEASALYAAYADESESGVNVLENPKVGVFSASLNAATVPVFNVPIPNFAGDVNATYESLVKSDVTPDWQWSPWTDFVTTELSGEFVKALNGSVSFDGMLKATQSALMSYAQTEGYTVSQ
jgi:multiple sugar transport system substrate-binding protein